jgi:hypothetical protein
MRCERRKEAAMRRQLKYVLSALYATVFAVSS